jgi:hypothetical protein
MILHKKGIGQEYNLKYKPLFQRICVAAVMTSE